MTPRRPSAATTYWGGPLTAPEGVEHLRRADPVIRALIDRLGPLDHEARRRGRPADAYGLPDYPLPPELERIAEPWRPWRSLASLYLWRSLDATPA